MSHDNIEAELRRAIDRLSGQKRADRRYAASTQQRWDYKPVPFVTHLPDHREVVIAGEVMVMIGERLAQVTGNDEFRVVLGETSTLRIVELLDAILADRHARKPLLETRGRARPAHPAGHRWA
jgi:hypothetical protein